MDYWPVVGQLRALVDNRALLDSWAKNEGVGQHYDADVRVQCPTVVVGVVDCASDADKLASPASVRRPCTNTTICRRIQAVTRRGRI